MQNRLWTASGVICASTAILMLGMTPAQAQGFWPWSWGKRQQPPAQSTPQPRRSAPDTQRRSTRPGGGTYRTLCVRTCDGFFFPINFKVGRSKFKADSEACVQRCGTIGRLFVHRNPGQKISNAVDLKGKRYVDLENAFRYQKEFVPGCECGAAGAGIPAFDTSAEGAQTAAPAEPVVEESQAMPRADRLPGAPGSGARQ